MTKVVGRVSCYTSLLLKTGEVKSFNFVSVTETQKYSFNTKGILGNKSLIKPGDIVIFELNHPQDNSEPEAININLVTENSDLETLSICAQSDKECFWYPFFTRYLELAVKKNENQDRLIQLCLQKLKLLKLSSKSGAEKKIDFLKNIPDILYLESKELRQQRVPEDYLKICEEILSQDTKKLEIIDEVCEYIIIFSEVDKDNLWGVMPLIFMKNKKIFDLAPNLIKIKYIESLINQLEQEDLYDSIVNDLSNLIKGCNNQECKTIIDILPKNLKQEQNIILSLEPIARVDFTWEDFKIDQHQISIWKQLSREQKIYSLYRSAEENLSLNNLIQNLSKNEDTLISFVMQLCDYPNTPFLVIHDSLLKLIIDVKGDLDLLFPLLVKFSFFPKKNEPIDLRWDDMRLECFLKNKNVNIEFKDKWENKLKLDVNKYLSKIQAWAKFVEKNSDRLKCRKCQQLMNFDPNYTKNSESHEITIFHCPDSPLSDRLGFDEASGLDGSKHNYNVYINHCWNCKKTVDSRDSLKAYGKNYRDQSWFKCAKCRAGKQPHRIGSVF